MSIRIKFSQSELRDRAATILSNRLHPPVILHVSPTFGGKKYLVLVEEYGRQKCVELSVWQIVDAMPIQEHHVYGDIFVCPQYLIPALLRLRLDVFPDKETLKRAYRKLSKQMHPDLGGDPQKFIELNDSYNLILEQLK